MSQQELLVAVTRALSALGIPSMLTGSVAAGLRGYVRATHDIDMVVAVLPAHVLPLVGAFPPPRYYLDEAAVREAVAKGGHFNLIDSETADKVDFWTLTSARFDQERFSRRQTISYHGSDLSVISPEDLILSKLDWARQLGGSRKQVADVVEIIKFHRGRLDETYIERWADRLGVAEEWARAGREAEAS